MTTLNQDEFIFLLYFFTLGKAKDHSLYVVTEIYMKSGGNLISSLRYRSLG